MTKGDKSTKAASLKCGNVSQSVMSETEGEFNSSALEPLIFAVSQLQNHDGFE